MSVDIKSKYDLINLGIAMKHFEVGEGNGKFGLKTMALIINHLK